MANETLARRYALAVFQLAQQAGRIEAVGNDLSAIGRAVGEDAATREFFVSPVIDRADKEKALVNAFNGRVDEIALHTVLLLVRKRRETILDEVITEYRKLELAARGLEPLTVITARELPESELRSLVDGLERVYNKKFDVTVRRDPSLIGGVRVAMGDRRIDGTVAGRLEELSRTLFAQQ
jgi:F-type H+-transporting ATPase subunit delta